MVADSLKGRYCVEMLTVLLFLYPFSIPLDSPSAKYRILKHQAFGEMSVPEVFTMVRTVLFVSQSRSTILARLGCVCKRRKTPSFAESLQWLSETISLSTWHLLRHSEIGSDADRAALIHPCPVLFSWSKWEAGSFSVTSSHTGWVSSHPPGCQLLGTEPSGSKFWDINLCLFQSALFSGRGPPIPLPLELCKRKKANILLILFGNWEAMRLAKLLNSIVPRFAHV